MNNLNFEKEKCRILENATAKNTKLQEAKATQKLNDFLCKTEISLDDCLSNKKYDELDAKLEEFFCTIRKSNGEKMKVTSLHALRYGINRKLKNEYNTDITDKSLFPKSSKLFLGVIVDLKREGLGCTKHFDKIADNDIKTIFSKLDRGVPQQLQWLLFFVIQLFFVDGEGRT